MSAEVPPRAYLMFSGTGPILILSSYPELSDPRLLEKLRFKGMEKFIAYQVDLAATRDRYRTAYDSVVSDLQETEDIRVLDFNGHQIMSNFSLEELGEPIKVG